MKLTPAPSYISQIRLVRITALAAVLLTACLAPEIDDQSSELAAGGTDVHLRTQRTEARALFRGGSGGYHSYRIPSIVRTNSGALLAFAEGRKHSRHDYGDIDIVMKRWTNDREGWSPLKVIFSKHGGTCGNPTAVVDRNTGNVWLFASYNDAYHNQKGIDGYEKVGEGDRRVYSLVSYDDGRSFTDLKHHGKTLQVPGTEWDAVGPGTGVQLRSGRLVIPAIARNIYSDDHGATWHYEVIPTGTSEGTIVELTDGRLMRNDRAAAGALKALRRRQVSVSDHNGENWSAWQSNPTLLDPLCQGSMLRYNDSYPPRLMFLNPAHTTMRRNMTIRVSYDEGRTWPIGRLLEPPEYSSFRGGYSSMAKTSDFRVAALYELGVNDRGGHSIMLRKFNLPWILGGTPEPVN